MDAADKFPVLKFHEELLLLALKDKEGTVYGGAAMYAYAMAGGIIAELVLANRIELDAGKNPLVTVIDGSPLDDAMLSGFLDDIARAKRRKRSQSWIGHIAHAGKLKDRTGGKLCDMGILDQVQGKVLFVFRQTKFPTRDMRPEDALISRLRDAIFNDDAAVEPRTATLIGLASASGLLDAVFGRKELKRRKQRIASIIENDQIGAATKAAIDAVRAAVVICCTMPAIMAATS
jgi:hypothetical protein